MGRACPTPPLLSFLLAGMKVDWQDFPGGAGVKNPPANAGDTGSIPGPEDPTCRRATKPVCHND